MPLIIPENLPAFGTLQEENIFVMPHGRAISQDIRPLEILIVNLMPNKIVTETQLARVLANSPLQVRLTLLHPGTHQSTHTSGKHLEAFYKTFSEIQHGRFDGMIVTGAPIEHLEYEQVDYWDELTALFDFARQNVYSSLYLCWGALAGLHYHHNVPKHMLKQKLSGVYPHAVTRPGNPLMRGFDDTFYAPHSRSAGIRLSDVEGIPELRVLAQGDEAGLHLLSTENGREIYMLGHMEYDKETLQEEYNRDLARGLGPAVPANYFEGDCPGNPILFRWRAHANLLYTNWLNYYVYQSTPFDLSNLEKR